MSSNLVRLSSGDTIQIRTGVLQGIGPQGPTGAIGPRGNTGPAGPQGIPGPTGLIDEFFARASSVGNPQSIGSDTEVNLSFPTISRDDPSVIQSLTNFVLPIGLWIVQCSVIFQKPTSVNASGHREIRIVNDGVEQERQTSNAIAGYDTAFSVRAMVESVNSDRVLNFKAFHTDSIAIAVTAVAVMTRIGPGQTGQQGAQGPAGPAGQVGPTGPQGPAGSLISNTTTIAAIGG